MIRQINAIDWPDDFPLTDAAIRIAGQTAAYGGDRAFLRLWETDGHGRLSLMDGAVTLNCGDPTEWEEIFLFLSMQPEIRTVRTDAETARRLAAWYEARGCAAELDTGAVMRLSRPIESAADIAAPLSPREIYPLLAACFGEALPPFDCWYADVSHKWRHGLCHIAAVAEDGRVTATAMTVAECARAALLGAVATHPERRGRGLASACVFRLAADRLAHGQEVWICPKNTYAQSLYIHLGFAVCGDWGTVTRRG